MSTGSSHTAPERASPHSVREIDITTSPSSPTPPPPRHRYTPLSSLIGKPTPGSHRKGGTNADFHVVISEDTHGDGASSSRSHQRGTGEGAERRDRKKSSSKEGKRRRLSVWRMMALTVSMGGSQVSVFLVLRSISLADSADCMDSVSSAKAAHVPAQAYTCSMYTVRSTGP